MPPRSAAAGSGTAVRVMSSSRYCVVPVSLFVQRRDNVDEIGIAVVGIEINRQLAVPVPVGCAGMEIAVQLEPLVLYSSTSVDIFDAVVDLKAPKDIPTVPTSYPIVEIPSIRKEADALFVRNTLAPPDAPVYPVEAVVARKSPVPENVKESLSNPLFVSCVAMAVVPVTVPTVSAKTKAPWACPKFSSTRLDNRRNRFFMTLISSILLWSAEAA